MHTEIDFAKIGRRIQEARKNSGKTQAEIAAICKCDPKHISAVETGRTHPSLGLLMKLSEELDVSVDYFLKDSPHAYSRYYIDFEFSQRLQRMNHQSRVLLLGFMDLLLDQQESDSVR